MSYRENGTKRAVEMGKPASRSRERLQNAAREVLFPRVAPAEITLFFYLLYLHILTFHAAIWRWVTGWFTNIRDGFTGTIQIVGGLWGYFLATFDAFFYALMVLWMFILMLCIVLCPLLLALPMGFNKKIDRDRAKELTATAMSLFYLITSILAGYLLYLNIAVSRLFLSGSLVETVQYVILWCFFIRQIACGLASLPFLNSEDPWVQEIMVSRVREHDSPWPALVIALAGATFFYIRLRGTYAVGLKAVVFAFVYANILLCLLDAVFSRIAALAGLRLPFRRKARPRRAGDLRAYTAPPRPAPKVRKAVPPPPEPNALCAVCGATCRVERSSNLSRGAYVPCPRCRGRLVPFTKNQE